MLPPHWINSWLGCITTEQQDFLTQQNRAALANSILAAIFPILTVPQIKAKLTW
jgi:hypothetical protein